jgi:hypothetical protein
MNDALAPLRPIDAAPVEHEGSTFIVLRDTSGYVEEQLVLTPAAFFIASLLDGNKTITDIQAAFRNQFHGAAVAESQIQEVVEYLDDRGFLQNRQFEAIRDRIDKEFSASATRPAWLAGRGYPDDAVELRAMIDGFFTGESGPGATDVAVGSGHLPGLIVPHIDFHRGHKGYAHGYRQLFSREKPDVVFIFGVAHAGATVPFILTRKHFDTPFGALETDQEIVSRLVDACAWDPFAWEGRHRTEHSIEFQAVMLAYRYGPDVKIVPILCASLCASYEDDAPGENPATANFLNVCRAIAAEPGRKVAVIAGADLAHVGKCFGDDFDIDESVVQHVADRDYEDLAHVTEGPVDADGFYRSVMKDLNERKVCGLNCIYATLKTLDGAVGPGKMHYYGYAPDPSGGIVSFASVTLG